MPMTIRDATNTARTITGVRVRDATNTLRTISEIWVRDSNNVPRLVFSIAPPMTASASPETVSGFTLGTGVATTDSSTITPSGGTAPYAYAWTLESYDNATPPTANTSSAATSDFTQTGIGIGDSYSAQWKCTVTDSSPSPYMAEVFVNSFWADIT